MSISPGLNPQLFALAFPFHLVLDRQMRIQHSGPALDRICPVERGGHWSEWLELQRPVIPPSFERFREAGGYIFLMRFVPTGLMLRGQWVYDGINDVLIFLGSPRARDLKELSMAGGRLADFPLHDATAEAMQMRETQKMVVDDLRESQTFLEKRNRELRLQQALARTLAEAPSIGAAGGEVLRLLCAEAGCGAGRLYAAGGEGESLAAVWPAEGSGLAVDLELPICDGARTLGRVELCGVDVSNLGERRGVLLRTGLHLGAFFAWKLAELAATEASKAKSRFLASMSHEIRTPMNGVLGTLTLMNGLGLTGEAGFYLDTARKSAEALLGVLNDILDFSKIEAGQLRLDRHEFSLRTLLEECLETFGERAAWKKVRLVADLPERLPAASWGDEARLRQVLLNLIGNAVKFTNAGYVTLALAELPSPEPGQRRLRFSVTDTGIGISPANLRQLFQAFVQADASTSRRFGGTGLGLTISRQLVELMGGAIGAESVEGEGSTFWVELQLEDAASGEEAAPASGATVWLGVEDPRERAMLTRELKRLGYGVAEPGEGVPALILVDAARYVQLPVGVSAPVVVMVLPTDDRALIEVRPGVELAPSPVLGGRLAQLLERSQPLAASAVAPPAETGRSVLVVEDNPVNQMIARRMLERLGHRVTVAGNGREALEIVAGARFDLILMDVQMPEMDGLEATRQIRARAGERIPIVALTAHSMSGDSERCLAAGMDGYLSKPLRIEQLGALMEGVGGKGVLPRALRPTSGHLQGRRESVNY